MEHIIETQRRLANRGVYSGEIDGIDGPKTQAARASADVSKDDEYVFSGVRWYPSPNYRLDNKPEVVVVHYTAASEGVTFSTFKSAKYNVSAHYVISEHGSVTQMVKETDQAWHAGKSEHKGKSNVNGFSIGIELVNMGPMSLRGNKIVDWTGREFLGSVDDINGKLWASYNWAQIEACAALVASIKDRHPDIKDVVGHEHVSPGRKTDPGPAFPWKYFRDLSDSYTEKMKETV